MNVKYETIKRITVTGKYEESKEAFDYCCKNKYHILRSGPVRLKGRKVDVTHYLIIAERKE